MNLMHEAMLSDFVNDICETGAGRIEQRVLLRWFGQERMSVGIRRELQRRFEAALLEEEEIVDQWSLLMVDTEDGHLSFAAVDLDDLLKGKGWWSNLSRETRPSKADEP
jgi:hypothetical protein